MNKNDEFTSIVLGFNEGPILQARPNGQHPDINIRYSNDQLLKIYKNLGGFVNPMTQIRDF